MSGDGPREILLTAHYDAVVLRDGTLSQGVVDNAASVVGVIEAAKILREKNLNHRVRVILFDQDLETKSVRNIHWDLQMIEFNGTKPLPDEVRSILGER